MPGEPTQRPDARLNLFDGVCVIVGVIVGAGLYEIAPQVAGCFESPSAILGVWALGGLLSLCGALCYAELAASYPRSGGDYVYLSRAYGELAGFLFVWGQCAVIRPALIAGLALVFARYFLVLVAPGRTLESSPDHRIAVAAAGVAVLTGIHLIGLGLGKWTQNVLTSAKVLGLCGIISVWFFASPSSPPSPVVDPGEPEGIYLALILVLFAFGGWNEVAYLAAEIKNPSRNILRSLLLGVVAVTVLYLLVVLTFLAVLGRAGVATSGAVAVETVSAVWPRAAGSLVAALIAVSALGSVNGLIFAGARIPYALGAEHRAFRLLGSWHAGRGTPVWALVFQGLVCIVVIFLARTFERAVLHATPVAWFFFMASTLAIFVLRRRDAELPRPYRVLGYPLTPAVFALACGAVIYSSFRYDEEGSALSVGILLLGLPLYWLFRSRHRNG